MESSGYQVELTSELKAEKDLLDEAIAEARTHGFLYDTHLEPLAIVIGYLETPNVTNDFYDMLSNPGIDPEGAMQNIGPLLNLYAGRTESIFRNGLLRNTTTTGVNSAYCIVQLLPLVGGPTVRGIKDIFGKEVSDRIAKDNDYIPMNKTYVGCCHNLTENMIPSNLFLVGSQRTMKKFIPETVQISEKISIDELCPYEAMCPFKEAYLTKPHQPSLRIITDPLENSLIVFQEKTKRQFMPEVYEFLTLIAKKINSYNDKLNNREHDPFGVNGRKLDTGYIQ